MQQTNYGQKLKIKGPENLESSYRKDMALVPLAAGEAGDQ